MPDQPQSPAFAVSRAFDAPRELLWACFTEPARMRDWWGPKGVKVIKSEMDFRVGGTYHYGMQNPDGQIYWGRQIFREIVPQQRIAFINSFSDEAGGLSRHPFAEQWPLQMLSIYTFDSEPGGKSRITIDWSPYEATAEEQAVFDAGHDSMTMGWGGTLDKLEAYVAKQQQQQQQ